MRLYLLLLSVLLSHLAEAQFDIRAPVVRTPSDTVFISPTGNDNNNGSISFPLKTFSAAISKLPFGTAGVNGGNAYGLIILLPGTYYTTTGFQQYANQWQSGNTFKNISVEGMDNVTICGYPDTFANSSLLLLSGNNIFIKNLSLRYGNQHGILLSASSRQNNVLIENVSVDSVKGFSMLFKGVDSILLNNCVSLRAARTGADTLTSPCQWPSGIKFLGCTHMIVHHSEIGFTRGEGLNFQNSTYGLAYENKLHDNGLNLYDDNSSHLIVRNNYLYNTTGISKRYWYACPADTGPTWPARGILLANEGSCISGNLPTFSNCKTNCTLPTETFNNIDSVFIYNNLFQNIGGALGFWEGSTQINGVNCIRNVFFCNNTVVGVLGDSLANNVGMIDFFFPDYNIVFNSYYSYLSNVVIANNIFSYDTSRYSRMLPVRKVVHPQHPGPIDIIFKNNMWIKQHNQMGQGDTINNNLPVSLPLFTQSVTDIIPCEANTVFVHEAPAALNIIAEDFSYKARNSPLSNVGAFEFDSCGITSSKHQASGENLRVSIYPNPFTGLVKISLPSNFFSFTISVFDVTSREIASQSFDSSSGVLDLGDLSSGIYLLKVVSGEKVAARRIIKH